MSGIKNDKVKIVIDQFDLSHENKKRSILSAVDTNNPINVLNIGKKSGYQIGKYLSNIFFNQI